LQNLKKFEKQSCSISDGWYVIYSFLDLIVNSVVILLIDKKTFFVTIIQHIFRRAEYLLKHLPSCTYDTRVGNIVHIIPITLLFECITWNIFVWKNVISNTAMATSWPMSWSLYRDTKSHDRLIYRWPNNFF